MHLIDFDGSGWRVLERHRALEQFERREVPLTVEGKAGAHMLVVVFGTGQLPPADALIAGLPPQLEGGLAELQDRLYPLYKVSTYLLQYHVRRD